MPLTVRLETFPGCEKHFGTVSLLCSRPPQASKIYPRNITLGLLGNHSDCFWHIRLINSNQSLAQLRNPFESPVSMSCVVEWQQKTIVQRDAGAGGELRPWKCLDLS